MRKYLIFLFFTACTQPPCNSGYLNSIIDVQNKQLFEMNLQLRKSLIDQIGLLESEHRANKAQLLKIPMIELARRGEIYLRQIEIEKELNELR